MLCRNCKVTFPFYLKYCRYCGVALQEEPHPLPRNTALMTSSSRFAETDTNSSAAKYQTAPFTMSINQQSLSIAGMAERILERFPSLRTVEMPPELVTPVDAYGLARSIKESKTLPELTLAELQLLEWGNSMRSLVIPTDSNDYLTKPLNMKGLAMPPSSSTQSISLGRRSSSARIHLPPTEGITLPAKSGCLITYIKKIIRNLPRALNIFRLIHSEHKV